VPLDATGRVQAGELAERAVSFGFAALWCSPLLRARETADIVARLIGLEPREEPRMMETDAGDWTNRSFAEVIAEAPERFAAFANAEPGFAFPGGESFAAQELRVGAALEDIENGLSVRIGRWLPNGQRVPNGALVPLEPTEAELEELGRHEATEAT